MTTPDLDALLETAHAAAQAGADIALRWWYDASALIVASKASPDDLVSQADTEAETAIRGILHERRPSDAVLGEEGGATSGTSGVRWVIDPIDGTTNFVYGRADWAVSVAAVDENSNVLVGVVAEPALARVTAAQRGGGCWSHGRRLPSLAQTELARSLIEVNLGRPEQKAHAPAMLGALIPKVRDVRRGGSAACALAQVATGRTDAAWLPGLRAWDYAAGVLLVSEAGGSVGDLAGSWAGRVPEAGDVLAAAPSLWEPLQGLLRPVYA